MLWIIDISQITKEKILELIISAVSDKVSIYSSTISYIYSVTLHLI